MSGKIITRVREREAKRERRLLNEAIKGYLAAETEPPMVWLLGMLKNWRQWFFKDGQDGGM